MSQTLSPADEGTIAHKLLELCVRKGLCSPLLFVGKTITVRGDDKQHSQLSPSGAGRFLKCMGSISDEKKPRENKDISAEVTTEMANAVEVAVDYIRNVMSKMKKPVLLPEHEVWIHALDFRGGKGHGTLDIYLYDDREVHVMDYKHGRGIPVEVEDNDQAKLYSVGVLDKKHSGKKFFNHILQPRSPHPDGPCRCVELKVKDLIAYEHDVAMKVLTYDTKTAKYCPGDHCKYCPKNPCPALADYAAKSAGMDFESFIDGEEKPEATKPGELSTKQLSTAMSRVDILRMFIKAVEDQVFGRLVKGDKDIQKFYKLVEGKANRTWRDEDDVIKAFKKLGLKPDQYAPRKLVGIGDGESLIPKDKREKLMTKLAHKPTGKTVIAPINDPRKPIRPESAKSDFKAHLEPNQE